MHPRAPIQPFPLFPDPGMWGPAANMYFAANIGMHYPLSRATPQHPIPPNQIWNNTIIQHPQLVYPPYACALPVRRWQHVTHNGNPASRVQRIPVVLNTGIFLTTPYQPLALCPSYDQLARNSFYFPAPGIWAPIRTPAYMAHPGMSVPTVSLPHQPPHFLHTLNNTNLYPTSGQRTPSIGGRVDCQCEHCTFNRRRVTQLTTTSARQANHTESAWAHSPPLSEADIADQGSDMVSRDIFCNEEAPNEEPGLSDLYASTTGTEKANDENTKLVLC